MPHPPASRDFYAILGVARDADADALKKAYRKNAVRYHPDKFAGKPDADRAAAEEKFKAVAEAYEVLSSNDKRQIYDLYGEDGLKVGGGVPQGSGVPQGGGFQGMPGAHFNFSTSGNGAGVQMDQARAEALFAQLFGGLGSKGGMRMGGLTDTDDDPFASLLGGMHGMAGMAGGPGGGMGSLGGMGGMGGMAGTSKRRRASSMIATDTLLPGTVVRLAGLSSAALNGSAGTVRDYDSPKERYVINLSDGSSIAVKPCNVRQVVSDAKVIGTSKEDLNGRVAATTVYDKDTGRYVCEGLTLDGTALSLKPENVMLPIECRVSIGGVTSRPSLNGRVGCITGVDRDRYLVRLSDETVSLRFAAVAAC